MISDRYRKAYTEVLEILSNFPSSEYFKIPAEKIEFYKKNRDKNYSYKINTNADLSKQNISIEANAILVSLFRDYFATEKEKQALEKILKENQRQLEEEKRNKYNPDDIFNKKWFYY